MHWVDDVREVDLVILRNQRSIVIDTLSLPARATDQLVAQLVATHLWRVAGKFSRFWHFGTNSITEAYRYALPRSVDTQRVGVGQPALVSWPSLVFES